LKHGDLAQNLHVLFCRHVDHDRHLIRCRSAGQAGILNSAGLNF
jgi:hypothetical protein